MPSNKAFLKALWIFENKFEHLDFEFSSNAHAIEEPGSMYMNKFDLYQEFVR